MGTTLQGKTPGGADATYKWLLHLGQAGALPASPDDAVTVSLGDGTDSPIQLWAGGMRIAGNHALHTGVQTLTGEQRDQARENIAADIACRFENRAPLNGAKATTPLFLGSLLSLTADTTGAAQNGYQLHLEEVGTAGPAVIMSPTPTSATIRINPAYYDGTTRTTTDLAADINGLLDYVLHPFSVSALASMACPTGWTAITATTSGGIDTDTPAAIGQRWIWPSQGRVWVATSLAPTVWQELGIQGQDFVGAAISGESLTSSGGAIVLGSGAAHSQLLSGATGLRINTLPDRTGTLATLNGPQEFAGNQTFSGNLLLADGSVSAPSMRFSSAASNTGWYKYGTFGIGYSAGGGARFRINGGDSVDILTPEFNFSGDVRLFRDAANVLALRNGTNPQVFRVYRSYTSGSEYEMGFLGWSSSGTFSLGTIKAGSGTARPLQLLTDNVGRILISESGAITIGTSATVNGVLSAPNQTYATATQVATIGEVRRKVGLATGDLRNFTLPASSSYVLDYSIADLTGAEGGYAEIMIYGPFSTGAALRGVFVIKAVFDISGGVLSNAKVVVENPMPTTAFEVSAEYVDAESLIRITVTNLGSGNRSMSARVVHALGRSS